MIKSVIAQSTQTIQNGLKDIAGQAQQLAQLHTAESGGDMNTATDALMQTKLSSIQIDAAVKLLKTADETLGSLLDIKV